MLGCSDAPECSFGELFAFLRAFASVSRISVRRTCAVWRRSADGRPSGSSGSFSFFFFLSPFFLPAFLRSACVLYCDMRVAWSRVVSTCTNIDSATLLNRSMYSISGLARKTKIPVERQKSAIARAN